MTFCALSLFLATCALAAEAAIQPLPANAKFDYQIGDPYTPAEDVRVVTRDRTASPVAGLYNICYINAFQTQAEDKSFWMGASRFSHALWTFADPGAQTRRARRSS